MKPFYLILFGSVLGPWIILVAADELELSAVGVFMDEPKELNPSQVSNLDGVRFLLWTRSNPENHQYYNLSLGNEENLFSSPFNASLPTLIICHGFNGNGEQAWVTETKTEYLKKLDGNVISVDYIKLVEFPWYNIAVKNIYRISNHTAAMIDWMHDSAGLQPKKLHMVGHSLGAHAAGLAAQYIKSGKVARVTGLDPAGPLFYDKPEDLRLDQSDADFVDVIHTNSGPLLKGCFGMKKSLGHADFYPNGGGHQPGCGKSWIDFFVDCSHMRATDFWIESINTAQPDRMFKAWPCSDWDAFVGGKCKSCDPSCKYMGFPATTGFEGSYFLRTNASAPFALGGKQ